MGLTWNTQPRRAWRVPLGALFITEGTLDLIERQGIDVAALIIRHLTGDWGDLDRHDRAHNDHALLTGTRLLSAYRVTETETIWIITDPGRAETTVLRPDEY